jgi:hypothetical protein
MMRRLTMIAAAVLLPLATTSAASAEEGGPKNDRARYVTVKVEPLGAMGPTDDGSIDHSAMNHGAMNHGAMRQNGSDHLAGNPGS